MQLILYLNSNTNWKNFTPDENTVKPLLYIFSIYPASKETAFAKMFQIYVQVMIIKLLELKTLF